MNPSVHESVSLGEPPESSAQAQGAMPIKMGALIEELTEYRDALDKALRDNVHPAFLFEREKFVDCILAAKNARAERDGKPLNARYFKNFDDLIRYLQKTSAEPDPLQPPVWRAIAPTPEIVNHNYGYVIHNRDGKNIVVAFESLDESFAIRLHDLLTAKGVEFPAAIHASAVMVLNTQKSFWGCPSFNIGAITVDSQHPEELVPLIDELAALAAEDGLKTLVINDASGNLVNFSFYLHAHSQDQTLGVADNPKWLAAGLDTLAINDEKQTLLEYHRSCRVTQKVHGSTLPRTFSNSIDRTRVKELDDLIAYLKDLQNENPAQAGQIFAGQLAEVWVSRPAGWERKFPVALGGAQEVLPSACAVWDSNHPCWKFPLEKRIEVINEGLAAIRDWRGPSQLRKDILAQIAQQTTRAFRDLEQEPIPASEAILADAPSNVAQTILVQGSNLEPAELTDLLSLHSALISHGGPRAAIASLSEFEGVIFRLPTAAMRTQFLSYLQKISMELAKGNDARCRECATIVLGAVKDAFEAAQALTLEEKREIAAPLTDAMFAAASHVPPTVLRQFHAALELAMNLDDGEIDQVLRWANRDYGPGATGDELAEIEPGNFFDATAHLANIQAPDWRSLEALGSPLSAGLSHPPGFIPPPPPPGFLPPPPGASFPPPPPPLPPGDSKFKVIDLEARYPTSKFKAFQRRLGKLLQRMDEQFSDGERLHWRQEQEKLGTLIATLSAEHFHQRLFPLSRDATDVEIERGKDFAAWEKKFRELRLRNCKWLIGAELELLRDTSKTNYLNSTMVAEMKANVEQMERETDAPPERRLGEIERYILDCEKNRTQQGQWQYRLNSLARTAGDQNKRVATLGTLGSPEANALRERLNEDGEQRAEAFKALQKKIDAEDEPSQSEWEFLETFHANLQSDLEVAEQTTLDRVRREHSDLTQSIDRSLTKLRTLGDAFRELPLYLRHDQIDKSLKDQQRNLFNLDGNLYGTPPSPIVHQALLAPQYAQLGWDRQSAESSIAQIDVLERDIEQARTDWQKDLLNRLETELRAIDNHIDTASKLPRHLLGTDEPGLIQISQERRLLLSPMIERASQNDLAEKDFKDLEESLVSSATLRKNTIEPQLANAQSQNPAGLTQTDYDDIGNLCGPNFTVRVAGRSESLGTQVMDRQTAGGKWLYLEANSGSSTTPTVVAFSTEQLLAITKRQLGEQTREAQQATSEVRTLSDQVSRYRRDLADQTGLTTTAQGQVESHQRRILQLQGELSQQGQELNDANDRSRMLSSEVAMLRRNFNDAMERENVAVRKVSDLNRKISALEGTIQTQSDYQTRLVAQHQRELQLSQLDHQVAQADQQLNALAYQPFPAGGTTSIGARFKYRPARNQFWRKLVKFVGQTPRERYLNVPQGSVSTHGAAAGTTVLSGTVDAAPPSNDPIFARLRVGGMADYHFAWLPDDVRKIPRNTFVGFIAGRAGAGNVVHDTFLFLDKEVNPPKLWRVEENRIAAGMRARFRGLATHMPTEQNPTATHPGCPCAAQQQQPGARPPRNSRWGR